VHYLVDQVTVELDSEIFECRDEPTEVI
jgi:hypothetical protein